MSAPITEAHVFTTAKVGKLYIVNEDTEAAQAIADSEARALEPWRIQVEELRGALALGQENCDDVFDDLRGERDQLRAEVERLRSDRDCEKRLRKDAEEFREDAIERAARAEADLAAERARLDWVFRNCKVTADGVTNLDRENLGAAMKEGAK